MARSQPRPTDAELAILRVLWTRGASTVRQVHEALADTRDTGYTTTLKLMQIMADKGLVKRNETARTHVYSACRRRRSRRSGNSSGSRRSRLRRIGGAARASRAERGRRDRRRAQGNPQADRRLSGETVMIDSASCATSHRRRLAWTLLHFLWQGALLGLLRRSLLLRLGAARTRLDALCDRRRRRSALMLITCAQRRSRSSRTAPGRVPAITRRADHRRAADVETSVDETVKDAGRRRIRAVDLSVGSPRRSRRGGRRRSARRRSFDARAGVRASACSALSLRLLGGWMLTRSLTAPRGFRRCRRRSSPRPARSPSGCGLRRAVAIVESGAVAVPTLVGWVKPVVLLPAAALSGLSPEQLQAILAHELAHVRRHDYLVNLLQSMVETLLFYHPAMWWVSAQVRAEREHCCDDLAVEVCGDRLVYVTALAELTSIASHRAFALAATDGSLVGRVQRILGRPRSVHEPAPAWALLALIVLLVRRHSVRSEPR